VSLEPVSTLKAIKANTVYRLEAEAVGNCENSTSCDESKVFVNRARSACRPSFLCSALSGNVCGDYGLKIFDGEDVCFHGRLHRGAVLASGQSANVRLWRSGRAESGRVVCFLWCTKDGHLPRKEGSTASRAVVDRLIASDFFVENMTTVEEGVQTFSPSKVLRLSVAEDDVCPSSNGGHCAEEYSVEYYGNRTCQSR